MTILINQTLITLFCLPLLIHAHSNLFPELSQNPIFKAPSSAMCGHQLWKVHGRVCLSSVFMVILWLFLRNDLYFPLWPQ